MALTPRNDDAFFREVDENLRRDQMLGLFTRWGRIAAGVVALFLVVLALGLWWRSHRAAQAGIASEQLSLPLAALEDGHAPAPADAAGLTQAAQSPRDGYKGSARLAMAGLAAQQGKTAEAAANYAAIAADADLPQPMRDLALVRGTALQFDTLAPNVVIDRLKGLAIVGNPWFPSAAELTGLAWLKLGRKDRAGALFAAIARDAAAPGSLRGRAAGMASALGQTVAPAQPGLGV